MTEERRIKRLVTRILRVPPRPEPPAGSPGSVRVFNAGPGFYRYRMVQWAVSQLGTAIGIIAGYFFFVSRFQLGPVTIGHPVIQFFEYLGLAIFLLQLPFTFLMIDLDFRYRWYMLTDTSLRIREGLITVREQTMTLANIQNLSIRQGPLQRLLGIADLQVRTAGGGGGEAGGKGGGEGGKSANMHLGYFRGVDRAGKIRDAIIAAQRGLRDAGLGNPDEPAPAAPIAAGSMVPGLTLVAAVRLRDEARALRLALERVAGR